MMRAMRKRISLFRNIILAVVLASAAAACSGIESTPVKEDDIKTSGERRKTDFGKMFGDEGLTLGGSKRKEDAGGGSGIGVNSYLWRASLDTVVFMPVNSADPFGGVIITDWHTPQGASADERFKLNIYILGRNLRADGVRVAVFRQTLDQSGQWKDASVSSGTGAKVEEAILMKARQLRNETLEQ